MILCLDYGTRYIGVAMTDPDERIALRYSTVDQKKREFAAVLKEIIEHDKISRILVGVPISLSGSESAQTRVTRNFIDYVRRQVPTIPIEEVDETLTSYAAEQQVRAEGGSREAAHAEAARIMLADYLALKR
ncbi:MAG: Holliday junction resolvase RuvX [Candidatus Andersenbacteria bacterium]